MLNNSLYLRTLKNHNLSLPLSSLNCRQMSTTTGLCPKKSVEKAEFAPKLTDLQMDAQQQQELVLENLKNHNLSLLLSSLN